MIVLLLLAVQLATAEPQGTVTFTGLPPEVERVTVYEWRDGRRPVLLAAPATRTGDSVVLRMAAGTPSLVAFEKSDGDYLLDGPFTWPAGEGTRRVEPRWRRTLHGQSPDATSELTTIEWMSQAPGTDVWPRCFWSGERAWECWGVMPSDRGVILAQPPARLWWTVVGDSGAGPMRSARWGRLLAVTEAAASRSAVRVVFARPVAPPSDRLGGIRLDTAVVSGAVAVPVMPGLVWVCGEDVPPRAWADVRTGRGGPVYLSLRDLAEGPPALPLFVMLPESTPVDGTIVGAAGQPAAGALVTIFRMIDPPAAAEGTRLKARRVFAAETIADSRGMFRADGIGDAEYEIVAFHAQLGRLAIPLPPTRTGITVQLRAPGTVQGRVVAGGRPLAGIAVVSVPDAAAFNGAEDVTEVKGGDARTGPDGRFSVMVAASGGGELRVGGGAHAITRLPLPRPPVPNLDLGDIELGIPLEVAVVLDRDPGCGVRAIGPIGRTGLQIVSGTRTGAATHSLALPEPGLWQFGLVCGEGKRVLSPGAVQVGAGDTGRELRFVVR